MRREPGAAAGVTLAAFIAELRAIGLPISVSENVDATAAVLAMPMSSRQSLKSALAATWSRTMTITVPSSWSSTSSSAVAGGGPSPFPGGPAHARERRPTAPGRPA